MMVLNFMIEFQRRPSIKLADQVFREQVFIYFSFIYLFFMHCSSIFSAAAQYCN